MFVNANATYLQKIWSDHSPIITNLIGDCWTHKGTFKYDHKWMKKEGFKEVVCDVWRKQHFSGTSSWMTKISSCRKAISGWKKEPSLVLHLESESYII